MDYLACEITGKENRVKKSHLPFRRIVDCSKRNESTNMLSILLQDLMVPKHHQKTEVRLKMLDDGH